MKRILLTGGSGYIGTNAERYLTEYNAGQGRECYHVDTLSLRDESWENYDFSSYDTVLHLAGIAHADIGHVSEEIKQKYYEVNCNLAVRTAAKAKAEGVPQFIYMSSVIIYGESAGVGKKKHITADTIPKPANFYGDSKWQAEQRLKDMLKKCPVSETLGNENAEESESDVGESDFCIACVRPPMVYGKGSKGNFPLLVKLAEKMPVFPDITNERSMIYIDNLCEFLRLLIDSGKGGTYLPQNAEYTSTSQMVKAIGEAKGKKIHLMKALNPFVKLASKIPGKIGGMANKAFGSLTIEQAFSESEISGYQIYDLQESIERSI